MTTTSMDLEEQKLFNGETFVASANGDLGSGGTIALLAENPSDSGTDAIFYFGDLAQEDESTVILYDEVSGISGGSAATVNNNHIGHSNTSGLTVTQDPTYSGDNVHQQASFTGADTHTIFDGYKLLLPPGENILLEITNNGSGNSQTSIRFAWAEKPEKT